MLSFAYRLSILSRNLAPNLHEKMEIFLLLLLPLSHHGLLRLALAVLKISTSTDSYVCTCQMSATDKKDMTLLAPQKGEKGQCCCVLCQHLVDMSPNTKILTPQCQQPTPTLPTKRPQLSSSAMIKTLWQKSIMFFLVLIFK